MKVLLVVIGLLIPGLTFSAGIQVAPDKLSFDHTKTTQDVVVANPTSETQVFKVYSETHNPNIQAEPENFTLTAGSRINVKVFVDVKKFDRGTHTATISVLGHPETESNLQINTGVKIPTTIDATQNWFWKTQTFRVVLFVLCITMIVGIGYYNKMN